MKKLIAIVCVLGLVSCGGGGTNNDQGVAFTLLGFSSQGSCTAGTADPNLTGLNVPFSEAIEDAGSSGGLVVGFNMRNNLCKQFIRTDQVFMDYFIPGAAVQPPSSASALGAFMDATFDDCDGEITGASASEACGETKVVPAQVRQWMILNRASLPELPFTMQIRATVSGITSAGDRLETNEAILNVQFLTDLVIEPGGSEGDDEDGDTGTVTESDDVPANLEVPTSDTEPQL